jgi:CheY-like chemotaxis protein
MKRRILVVDDDRTVRHLVTGVLTRAGFATTAAGNGVEALKALKTRRVDLVVCDIWMPEMTGLELLEKLRARKTQPRVVVITSDDTPETLLGALRQQAVKYVRKPVDAVELLHTVRKVLDAPAPPAIDVISARPEWVELEVPCTLEAAERLQAVMAELNADLAPKVRESLAYTFRELLMNAIEWGGQLDPSRKVRISYLRAKRMLLYRIADPGPGFELENLTHAAIGREAEGPIAHMQAREEKGMRPGGFGLLMVRNSVDELLHNEKRNEVVFVKYL